MTNYCFLLCLLFLTLCNQASAQFSVPYIHVEKAKPLDTSSVYQELIEESNTRVIQLYQELTRRYEGQVVNVDMLPLRKQKFLEGATALTTQQSNTIKAEAWAYCGENSIATFQFKVAMNKLFDASLI